MRYGLEWMSGEELLVLRVLGGELVHPDVDRELDHRAHVNRAFLAEYAPQLILSHTNHNGWLRLMLSSPCVD
jgi:hypothetical protein